jgi:methionyl-tRNA formyltransferase
MKIVLFGEDIFSASVLQSLVDDCHSMEAVVCPFYPDNLEYKSLEIIAAKNVIPFFHQKNINAVELCEALRKMQPDLIVCVHLKKILTRDIYLIPKNGSINVHPSLLPKYKGLSPEHQALIHGDTETGVTIHFIDEGVDTGDIIIQEKIPLPKDTNIFQLQMKILSVYKHLVPEAIRLIVGKKINAQKQDSSHTSWFGRLKDSDREINLKRSKFDVYNLIRAVSKPFKGAYHDRTIIWASFMPDPETENEIMKRYQNVGIYAYEDKLLIRLPDGILISDDFEIVIR